MNQKQRFIKIITLMILLLAFSSTVTMGYAYWDLLTRDQNENMTIGDWGIPLSTPQQFYDFAMKTNSVSTDRYFLQNDIDFTGFSWAYTSANNGATFRGMLDGNGKTLSNLTLYMNNSTYSYFGIFPRMQGGSVYNLTLSKVNLTLSATTLSNSTSLRSGLISGNAFGLTNTISGITVLDCGVRGTSTSGTGGLIGSVTTATTIVNIANIKATGLRVFSKTASVGGLVGYAITSGTQINVADVDLQGEVYAYSTSSYSGGIIGRIASGAHLTVNRAIIEMTSYNTLETNSTYYHHYSERYLGGLIGYCESVSANVTITDAFFTGSLFTQTNNRRADVGTATGRLSSTSTNPTLQRTYYANVEFRSSTGTITHTVTAPTGQMAELVPNCASVLPDSAWWNTFGELFISPNNLWAQDGTTHRLYLIR